MKQQKKFTKPTAKKVVKSTSPPKPMWWDTLNPVHYAIIITAVFFVVALFGILHHEMWRDEIQPWLIAKESHSIGQLFHNMRFEGHPVLWHLMLFFITCITHTIFWQQALHLLIACGFIFIFNRYSTIAIPYKILFTFGYFPLYEYAVITRDYGLAVLLIFTACALYKNRASHYILLGIVLATLANVSIYGVMISLAISGVMLLDYIFYQDKNVANQRKFIASLAIVFVGIILSLYQIIPDKDNGYPGLYAKELFEMPRWESVANRIFVAYFYIPKTVGIHFWNTNIFFDDFPVMHRPLWDWYQAHSEYLWGWIYMPITCFLTCSIIFLRKPLILLLYVGGTLGLLLIFYYTDLINMRYGGYFLIVLIVCYWLAKYYPDAVFDNAFMRFLANAGRLIAMPFLVLVLVFNIIGAMVAYSKEINEKFSAATETAKYIKDSHLDTLTIVGTTDFAMSPLSNYLDKKIYYPQMSDYGSFTLWSKSRKNDFSLQELFASMINLMNQGHAEILLVKNSQPSFSFDGGKTNIKLEHAMIAKDIRLDLIKSFEAGIVADEEFYIYIVQRIDPSKEDVKSLPVLY